MASDKEGSPNKSRQQDDRKKRRKMSSHDVSPHHKGKRRSSSSSQRSPLSSRSASPSEKHRSKRSEKSSKIKDDRSRSRTPTAYRKDAGDRDDPNVCHCLGVFGLSSYTQEKDLKEVFGRYGAIDDICIIYDRQSGHSKGYGFVYYKSTADAIEARRETQGLVLDRRPIRVDYSFTTRPHSPTPGRYMGRRDLEKYCHDGDYDERSNYRDGGRRGGYRERQHYCDYDNRDDYRDDYDDSYSKRSRRYSPYSRRH